MNQLELPEETHQKITNHCEAGDKLAELGEFRGAISEYNKAWVLIPEPKSDWNAATWVLAAIADACFLGGFRDSAREALTFVMTCPGAIGNPFLHLRFGQVLLDEGEEDAAADELIRAYMGAGEEIFAAEDPRYFSFLRSKAIIDLN